MFRVSSCSCLCPADCQVLSREWRLCWSNTDYIWVINNFIAYWGASYIRCLMVWLIIHASSTFWTNVVRCSYLSMPLISDFVYESSYLFEINSDPRVISEAAVSNINILNSRVSTSKDKTIVRVLQLNQSGVSNHRQFDNLFNSLFRLTTNKYKSSVLLVLCKGNPLVTGGSLHK